MAIGIDPLIDFACKKLLGSPEHPAITLHFLNAVLKGFPQVVEVEILNPIVEKDFENDKYSIMDVRASDAYGHRFNIEIQRTMPVALRERLVFYAASQLIEQIGAGEGYERLRPSIGVCILDVVLFRQVDDIHIDFRLMNEKNLVKLTDHLQIHLLELPKYALPSHNERLTDPIEKWCYFFRQAPVLTAKELAARLDEPVFFEAIGVLEMIARDPEQRRLYEDRLKMERDARANIDYALYEGRERGREEGREEGERIGEIRGKVKVLRDLLQEMLPTDEELKQYSQQQLSDLEVDFRRRLRDRI